MAHQAKAEAVGAESWVVVERIEAGRGGLLSVFLRWPSGRTERVIIPRSLGTVDCIEWATQAIASITAYGTVIV